MTPLDWTKRPEECVFTIVIGPEMLIFVTVLAVGIISLLGAYNVIGGLALDMGAFLGVGGSWGVIGGSFGLFVLFALANTIGMICWHRHYYNRMSDQYEQAIGEEAPIEFLTTVNNNDLRDQRKEPIKKEKKTPVIRQSFDKFSHLPPEIVEHTLCQLPLSDLGAAAISSNRLLNENSKLAFIKKAELYGFVEKKDDTREARTIEAKKYLQCLFSDFKYHLYPILNTHASILISYHWLYKISWRNGALVRDEKATKKRYGSFQKVDAEAALHEMHSLDSVELEKLLPRFKDLIFKFLKDDNLGILLQILKLEVTPNIVANSQKNTPLHLAVTTGSIKIVKALLDYGAKTNLKNQAEHTPLLLAAEHPEITRLLLEHGAQVNTLNGQARWTSLHHAARHGYYDSAELLVKHQADITLKTDDGSTPLHIAVQFGFTNICSLFLSQKNANINAQSNSGRTPLIWSVLEDNVDMLTFLLKYTSEDKVLKINEPVGEVSPKEEEVQEIKGDKVLKINEPVGEISPKEEKVQEIKGDKVLKIDLADNEGRTPLYWAVKRLNGKAVKLLLAHGADPKYVANDGTTAILQLHTTPQIQAMLEVANTPFLYAVRYGSQERITAFLLEEDTYNQKDLCGRSCLHLSIGKPEVLRQLLENELVKELINEPDSTKFARTPLHYAVIDNNFDAVSILLEHEATASSVDADGRPPAHFTSGKKIREILARNWTPLHFAAHDGNIERGEKLAKSKDLVNARDRDGKTPLHCCVLSVGFIEFATMLLDNGADSTLKTLSGNTALHLAVSNGHSHLIPLLCEHNKENINARDSNGYTPLMMVTKKSELVEYLLRSGADVNAQDNQGRTALHWAVLEKNLEVIKLLLDYGADRELQMLKGGQLQTPRDISVSKEISETLRIYKPPLKKSAGS